MINDEWIAEFKLIMENGCEPMQLYGIVSRAITEHDQMKAEIAVGRLSKMEPLEITRMIDAAGRRSCRRQRALETLRLCELQDRLLRVFQPMGKRSSKKRPRAEEIYAADVKRAAQFYHQEVDTDGEAGLVEMF